MDLEKLRDIRDLYRKFSLYSENICVTHSMLISFRKKLKDKLEVHNGVKKRLATYLFENVNFERN